MKGSPRWWLVPLMAYSLTPFLNSCNRGPSYAKDEACSLVRQSWEVARRRSRRKSNDSDSQAGAGSLCMTIHSRENRSMTPQDDIAPLELGPQPPSAVGSLQALASNLPALQEAERNRSSPKAWGSRGPPVTDAANAFLESEVRAGY